MAGIRERESGAVVCVTPQRMLSLARSLFALGLTLVLALGAVPPGSAQISAGATLTVLVGAVSVQQSGGASVGRSGLTLSAGDIVSTGADGRAQVTFFEGSEVELDSSATLQITEANSAGTQTRIGVTALTGSTIHRVVALSDPASMYRVESGTTVLLVRGTVFGHRAAPGGDVIVALDRCGTSPLSPQDCVDFPAPGQKIQVGEKVTAQLGGGIVRERFTPGTPLFNIVQPGSGLQQPGSSGPVSSGPGASARYPSVEACVLDKRGAGGQSFDDALSSCSAAFAATPTPTPIPAAPVAPPPLVLAAAPNVSSAPIDTRSNIVDLTSPVTSEDDGDDADDNDNDDDDSDNHEQQHKKPSKPKEHHPTAPKGHPGCSC